MNHTAIECEFSPGSRPHTTLDEVRRSEARCLDPHDLVLAKLAAHREKDLDFCWDLAQAGLLDTNVLRDLLPDLPVSEVLAVRIASWIDAAEASSDPA